MLRAPNPNSSSAPPVHREGSVVVSGFYSRTIGPTALRCGLALTHLRKLTNLRRDVETGESVKLGPSYPIPAAMEPRGEKWRSTEPAQAPAQAPPRRMVAWTAEGKTWRPVGACIQQGAPGRAALAASDCPRAVPWRHQGSVLQLPAAPARWRDRPLTDGNAQGRA
jgi:hypothetical protein